MFPVPWSAVRRSLFVVGLVALSGCIVEAPTNEKPASSSAAASSAAGQFAQGRGGSIKSGAQLEGRLELVGANFLPAQVVPGLTTRVVMGFRVMEALPDADNIFVHVEDAETHAQLMNLDHAPSTGRPTNTWKKGEVVRDDFAIPMPAGAQMRSVSIYVGVWNPVTDRRMTVSNADKVNTDGNNRILLATLPVAAP